MNTLIVNGTLVSEGQQYQADLLIVNGRIHKIGNDLQSSAADKIIDAAGKYVLPGMIDDQVHFREPGLTHKGGLQTESRAAVAGGITSFMDMPNVKPPTVNLKALDEKFALAEGKCAANYAFYMGATNDNLDELRGLKNGVTCGIKIFMGASTGNMLVDDPVVLENIFAEVETIVITHCEDTPMIKRNEDLYRQRFGDDIPLKYHPEIRSVEACYASTERAVGLARKHGTRLHVLHLTSEKELEFFAPGDVNYKQITLEVCAHHLFFSEEDYEQRGAFIKCNPAIKKATDRAALIKAVAEGRIDIIATDHAPHTLQEKTGTYFKTAAGLPLVQYALPSILEKVQDNQLSLEKVVQVTSHNVADSFRLIDRGYLREGYWADITIVDMDKGITDSPDTVLYKCAWSPFDGFTFRSSIDTTIVNGEVVYVNGQLTDALTLGRRLEFRA